MARQSSSRAVVRNHTRGRRTLYLDYEAYEEMALKQMEELAERALADFKIRDVVIVHRLGRLEIGETSVLIVVASAHRAAAFDACRWLIDTLKRTVPIWKKGTFRRWRCLGRRRTFSRGHSHAPRAPIPQSVHLSEQAVFALGAVQNAAKYPTFPDETSCNCWPCAGPVSCLRCAGASQDSTPLSKLTSSW